MFVFVVILLSEQNLGGDQGGSRLRQWWDRKLARREGPDI